MAAERDSPQVRARQSRLQNWKQLALQASSDLELPESAPDSIAYLDQKLPIQRMNVDFVVKHILCQFCSSYMWYNDVECKSFIKPTP